MSNKKIGAFYICVKLNFSFHFCYYFRNDLKVGKSSKKFLKNFKIT